MATALHEVEALEAIAEGAPGMAQGWAAARLAVIAPQRFTHLPTPDEPLDEVLAASPPALVPCLIDALTESERVPVALAASAASLGMYGALPADVTALAEALRGALRGDGHESELWLAYALAGLGAADAEVLRMADAVQGPDRPWLFPAVVLRAAERIGALDEVVVPVARAIATTADATLLGAVLGAVGLPNHPSLGGARSVEEAIALGAGVAGGAAQVTHRRGSRKRQVQHAVNTLLDGLPGPGPALLRALYGRDANPQWGMAPVAIAAWLRAFTPADPLDDVIERLGGADPIRLSAARAAITATERDRLLQAIPARRDPAVAVLAMPLLPGDPALARAVVDLLVSVGAGDLRTDALARAAAWHCADQVPDLLRVRATRDLGLLVAEWTPTEEVLAALLALPVPADRDPRLQYAMCLASMGDPAVVPILEALLAHDESGDLRVATALAESILHVRIG